MIKSSSSSSSSKKAICHVEYQVISTRESEREDLI